MIAFATCVGSPETYRRRALAGLRRVSEPDSQLIEADADAGSISAAYNEILDHAATLDGLEALVLLHEDVELVDPAFCARIRARLAAPAVAVIGAIGAVGVRSLAWWEGSGRGRVVESRGTIDFGGAPCAVDTVDGLLLVLSPWAVANLRFDGDATGFHGYDAELCFRARAAGREVWVDDLPLVHHTKGGYGDREAYAAADAAFRARWVPEPAVSVLVPTFNRSGYLAQALDSVLAQTHRNLEIIIGDNASTDDTPAVCAAYAARDDRIEVVRRSENLDYYGNSMDLLARAGSDHVKFCLDDDLLMPRAVERLVAPLAADPGVALATSRRRPIDGAGRPLSGTVQNLALHEQDTVFPGPALVRLMLRTTINWVGELSTTMFRRSAVPDPSLMWTLEGRQAVMNGDVVLWLSLLEHGACAYLAEELSCFRIHEDQGGAQLANVAAGLEDWPHFIDYAQRRGLLDDDDRRTAWASVAAIAARLDRAAGPQDPPALARVAARCAAELKSPAAGAITVAC